MWTLAAIFRSAARDSRWEESKHPRDKEGKFKGNGAVNGRRVETDLQNAGNGAKIELEKRIANGEISLTINRTTQLPHMLETREEGKSYFIISYEELQEIVRQRYSTGRIIISKSGQIKEVITMDKPIGFNVSPATGIGEKTNRFTIHYSKARTHCVPAKGVIKWRNCTNIMVKK